MNVRIVTIIVVTLIPIIIVAIIILQHLLEEDPEFEKCEAAEVCVRLCCEQNSSCDIEYDFKSKDIGKNLTEPYKIVKYKPCHNMLKMELNDAKFLENGYIIEPNENKDEENNTLKWDEYCLDIENDEIFLSICGSNDITEKLHATYAYFMLASMPFLIATLVVYGFLKDLRNLHGKCLIAYVSSLTTMYATLIMIKLYDVELADEFKITCSIIGYGFLTSVLCCFFWLNIMCYDIYRTFRKGMKSEDNIQFFKYCGYAFGIPIIISIVNFILNKFEIIPDDYNNGIGNTTCTILSESQTLKWIYIYGPIVLLLAGNIAFYGITAWKIFNVQKETSKVVKSENSQRHSSDNHTRFFLYMRLSIVMGVPWIVEFLSFMFVDSDILFIASIFNCMQGFVVFITFVWNPKVTKQLKRRYTAMSVSYKKRQSSSKMQSVKGESVKGESVDTAVTKVNGFFSESSAQV